MKLYQNIVMVTTVIVCLVVCFQVSRKYVSQNIFRKIVHLITGLVYIKLQPIIFQECEPIQFLLPFSFLPLYLLMLKCFKKFSKMLERQGQKNIFGIIEYILLFSLYPVLYCDDEYGQILMCLLGGDGLAAFSDNVKNKKKLFYNKNKSYAVTAIAESLPFKYHDNLILCSFGIIYTIFPLQTQIILAMSILMSFFYNRKSFTASGAIVGLLLVYAHFRIDKPCFMTMLAFGILGTLSSSFKKRKLQNNSNDSVNEQKHGRNAFQVFENSIASLSFAILYKLTGNILYQSAGIISSATCLADTWASDFGMMFEQKVVHPVKFTPVIKGVNGGITLQGSLIGLLGSFVISVLATSVQVNNAQILPQVMVFTAFGFIGCYLDSLIGIYLQASYLDEEKGTISNTKKQSKFRNIGGLNILSNGAVNLITSFGSGLLYCYFHKYLFNNI